MRFTITAPVAAGPHRWPVPSPTSSVTSTVAASSAPLLTARATATSPGRYYSDSGEGAGRWLGLGADELGMAGLVDDHEFAQVLAGRHPRTGERLITAQGSAGRTTTLGVGTETRRTANGERLYDLADAAACLHLDPDDVDELVASGERAAFEQLLAALTGVPDVTPPGGETLVPCIDATGTRLITETEFACAGALPPGRAHLGISCILSETVARLIASPALPTSSRKPLNRARRA